MSTVTPSFNDKYVSTNIRQDAQPYSPELVNGFKKRLDALGAGKGGEYSYALLTSIFIGAHRPDHVPRMFEEVIQGLDLGSPDGLQEAKKIYYCIREAIMVIWPFVGIPWCVPSGLGLASIMQKHGIENIGGKRFRESFEPVQLYKAGQDIHLRTYAKVNNPEVREMLSVSLPEFRDATTAIVWGFNIAGANQSGVFQESETELVVAAAIHSEGASRQARSHVKASIAMGNSVHAVKEMVNIGSEFATWAGNPLPYTIDVDALYAEVAV